MRSDERDDIQPVIDELLELVAQLAPEARPHLALQQGVSRLVFEAYRRGLRRGRRPRSSSLNLNAVTIPADKE